MKLALAIMAAFALTACRQTPEIIEFNAEPDPAAVSVSVHYEDVAPAGLDVWVGARRLHYDIEFSEVYTVHTATMEDGSILVGVGINTGEAAWLGVFLAPPGEEIGHPTDWVAAEAVDAFDRFPQGLFVEQTLGQLVPESDMPAEARIRRIWRYDKETRSLIAGPWANMDQSEDLSLAR